MQRLMSHVLPIAKLWEYFVIDVEAHVQEFRSVHPPPYLRPFPALFPPVPLCLSCFSAPLPVPSLATASAKINRFCRLYSVHWMAMPNTTSNLTNPAPCIHIPAVLLPLPLVLLTPSAPLGSTPLGVASDAILV